MKKTFGVALCCPSLLFAQFLQYTPLIPTGEQAGQTWKYTTTQPAANWYQT